MNSFIVIIILAIVAVTVLANYVVSFMVFHKKHGKLSEIKKTIEEKENELRFFDKRFEEKRKLIEKKIASEQAVYWQKSNEIKLNLEKLKRTLLYEQAVYREKSNETKINIDKLKKKDALVRDKYIELNGQYKKILDRLEEFKKKDLIVKSKCKILEKEIKDLERNLAKKNSRLNQIENRTEKLITLEENSYKIKIAVESDSKRLSSLKKKIQDIEDVLQDLKSELDLYSRIKDYVGYGIFEEPEYLHETPERYQAEIKIVRDKQKALIKENNAVELAEGIEIEGSSKTANAVMKGQEKLMLRAFNIECDNLLGKLNPSNFDRTLERIEKIAEGLEKTTVSLSTGVCFPYIELKFEECRLLYEYKLRKAAQDEEQRLIREQIREEAKVKKEYEKSITEAEREEKLFKVMLEKIQKQFEKAHEDEKGEMQNQILILETQLNEAQEKAQRAKSMAEQTRKGHVYIISNIGSFGDEVYKIGLTRRLEPLDRVRELGGASVPFTFDVHAMIYSNDAPTLEKSLHKHFNHSRVNAVNRRKEFFQVPLGEIKSAVEEIAGNEADFIMTAAAEEYYETIRLQGDYSPPLTVASN